LPEAKGLEGRSLAAAPRPSFETPASRAPKDEGAVGQTQTTLEVTFLESQRQPCARAFRSWARLMHRRTDALIEDAMIAATAAVHDLTVVTRNTRDFK
jgi:predicted nucleic acid-binding protein